MDIMQIIVSVSGILVAILGAWVGIRKARTEAGSAAREMFADLCEAQQASIAQLTQRIESLRIELNQVRAEAALQRAENAQLRERVRELETEIDRLKRERAELRAKLDEGE